MVYALRFSTGPFRGEPPTLGNMFSIVSRSAFWLMLVIFTLSIGANVGVYSMLPVYMQAERGIDQTFTNFLLSASRITALITPFISGWYVHRFGPKMVMAVIIVLTGITTVLIGLAPNSWLWLPIFIQSPFVSAFFPPAFAALTAITPERYRNLIISLMMPAAMLLGSGVLPTLIGAFGDSGMFDVGFVLIGGLVAVSAFLIFFLQIPARQ
jgi:NNP family nitrate/nitrite transporter-like MFS transporter